MKKRLTMVPVVVLIIALLLGVTAQAAQARASAYMNSRMGYIYSDGSGDIDVEFAVVATGPMTTIGASKIQLYKNDGTLVKTFWPSSYPHMYSSFVSSAHSSSVPYSGVAGQSYYAVITFYVANANGSESKTLTTCTAIA